MPTSLSRYVYRGLLGQPLRPGESPANKLPLLHADLGVTTDLAALLAFVIRHISGFQRAGPKSRAYPSGPLRWHLKPHERPEDKLPLLYAFLGCSTPQEALLRLVPRHVPGFRSKGPLRNGGRKRVSLPVARRQVEAASAAAEVNEAWMCDIIDMYREHEPGKKLFAIAYDLAREKPPTGCENPAYELDPQWIVQRYTNRKRYAKASDRRFERTLHEMKTCLQMRAQTARHN